MSATLKVDGLTCGHCVSSVTEELTAIETVTAVEVELVKDGTSTVSVAGELTKAQAQAAIDEAGYTLVEFAVS